MISANCYFRMSKLLNEGKKNSIQITRKLLPASVPIKTYDPIRGCFYKDYLSRDYHTTILREDSAIWMSDSPMEQESLRPTLKRARGDVLIVGLGLGLLPALLSFGGRPVQSITIVESNRDVIDLVWLQLKRFLDARIVFAKAEDYLAETSDKFDFVYVDIWMNILAPIQKVDQVRADYQKLLKSGGELRVWLQELYDRVKGKLPKEPISSGGIVSGIPCLVCGKSYIRHDYAGLCMDCADVLEVSEMFLKV